VKFNLRKSLIQLKITLSLNVPSAQAEKKGLVMVNFFSYFLTCANHSTLNDVVGECARGGISAGEAEEGEGAYAPGIDVFLQRGKLLGNFAQLFSSLSLSSQTTWTTSDASPASITWASAPVTTASTRECPPERPGVRRMQMPPREEEEEDEDGEGGGGDAREGHGDRRTQSPFPSSMHNIGYQPNTLFLDAESERSSSSFAGRRWAWRTCPSTRRSSSACWPAAAGPWRICANWPGSTFCGCFAKSSGYENLAFSSVSRAFYSVF